MQYEIVTANNSNILMSKVNILISKGWVVSGGVSVILDPFTGNRDFYQAMIFVPQH